MKRQIVLYAALLLMAVSRATSAEVDPHAQWYIYGETDRNPVTEYRSGDRMNFTLRAERDGKPFSKDYTLVWTRTGDDFKTETGRGPADRPVRFSTSLNAPGFVRVRAVLLGPDGAEVKKIIWKQPRSLSFEGGAGADVTKIAPPFPEPADFDEFWMKQRERLAAKPLKYSLRKLPASNATANAYIVTAECPGNRPLTAFLSIPAGAAPHSLPAEVSYEHHGVGKTTKFPHWLLRDKKIRMYVNAHGYELEREKEYYTKFGQSIRSNARGYAEDPVQNSVRENAYFLNMVLRDLRSLEVIRALPEWDGRNLTVSGGSQGGLRTIWTAALDPSVTKANLSIPWCCGMEMTTVGKNRNWGVQGTPALRYFDPVYLASRIRCPVTVETAGLGDYTSPPRGVAAFCNALRVPWQIRWVQGGWHNPRLEKDGQPFPVTGNPVVR